MEGVLERLRRGPLASLYLNAKVEAGTCRSRKYGVGQCQDHCFRRLRVRMRFNPHDAHSMMHSEWDLFKHYSVDSRISLDEAYDRFRANCDPDHKWTFKAS